VDCCNLQQDDPQREVEFLHRQMNEEVNGMECAARTLTDFPEAEWELRMAVARQCYDEARHVEMFRRAFERRGGTIGQYPVLNFQFRIITAVNDLCGRLAVQNRTFESEGIDAVEPEIEAARERGDVDLAELFDAQLADEICHVRYANEFISRTTSQNPLTVMRIGQAFNYASAAFLQVMGQDAIDDAKYTINEKGRLEAGFSGDEIARLAEFRGSGKRRAAPDQG